MATLHIHKENFGSIQPALERNGEKMVYFTPDPVIGEISPSLRAYLAPIENEPVPASAIKTIEVDDRFGDALKVLMVRNMQKTWNDGYATIFAKQDSLNLHPLMKLGIVNTVSDLIRAAKAEQKIANDAVERMIANLPSLKPFWVPFQVENVFVSNYAVEPQQGEHQEQTQDAEGPSHRLFAHIDSATFRVNLQDAVTAVEPGETPFSQSADNNNSLIISTYYPQSIPALIEMLLPVDENGNPPSGFVLQDYLGTVAESGIQGFFTKQPIALDYQRMTPYQDLSEDDHDEGDDYDEDYDDDDGDRPNFYRPGY